MNGSPSGWRSSGLKSREVHCRAPTLCALTDTGPLRPINEDCVYVSAHGELLIIADGLGGHAAGEVASALAVVTLRDHLETTVLTESAPTGADLLPALAAGFQAAHRAVLDAAAARPEWRGMGTTLLAAVCRGADLYLAHVGDGRAYRLSGTHLERLTEDHTALARLIRDGVVAPDAAARHPLRHHLLQAIGDRAGIRPELAHYRLPAGDCLLLCSDGLWSPLTDADLADLLRAPAEVCRQAERLAERALAAGGLDSAR